MDQIKQLRKSRDMVKLYNDRLERLQVRCLALRSLADDSRPPACDKGDRGGDTPTHTHSEHACPQVS